MRFLSVSAVLALFLFLHIASLTNRRPPVHVWSDTQSQAVAEVRPSIQTSWSADSDKLTLEELEKYVAGKSGYYVRDWSLGLGWNNVRDLSH